MTSSILPRSEILQFQDDRFEKLYEQYDDEQLGALDEEGDVIGGMKDLKDIENVLDEFLEKSNASQMKTIDVTRDQENTKVANMSDILNQKQPHYFDPQKSTSYMNAKCNNANSEKAPIETTRSHALVHPQPFLSTVYAC